MGNEKLVSIIVPAYNESKNLPLLYAEIKNVLSKSEYQWELIVIDDHSSDETFDVTKQIGAKDARVRGMRFSRNYGSHVAIFCGLEHAQGDCAVILAADLQDPPGVIPELCRQWENGDHIVWAVRASREGEKRSTIGFSRIYYFLMRRIIGIRDLPAEGADFFLIDRLAIDSILQFTERNISIFALISWTGYKQSFISYDKKERAYGKSGWNFKNKIKLAIDSVISFSYLPIRLLSYLGVIISIIGFIYAGIVFVNAVKGLTPQGWSSTMVVILALGGVQMIFMGVLGEYMWRTLDESRNRPRYIIETQTDREN